MVPATVLGKALTVLQAFTVEDTELGFAELGRRTGLAKATLHRTLAELLEHRLLERPDGRFRLSGLVFELGMRAAVGRGLLEVAAPYLEDLFVRTRETVHLGVREGTEVVYVAKSGGHRQVDAPSRLGGRMPLHATAIGKVLLAHAPPDVRETVLRGRPARLTPRTVVNVEVLRRQLDRVLERGVALEHEESAVGVTCVAAVVADGKGGARAAVSVTGPVHRFDPERHLDAVRAAGAGIASMLVRGRSG
jgi:DNA-binding IclR family transcriptional regulator